MWPRGGRGSKSDSEPQVLPLQNGVMPSGAPRATMASDLAFWGEAIPLDTPLASVPSDTNVGLSSEVPMAFTEAPLAPRGLA